MTVNLRLPAVAGRAGLAALLLCGLLVGVALAATDGEPPTGVIEAEGSAGKANPNSGDTLALAQKQIAEKYRHLEEVLLRMAELSGATDPRRAALLKKAVVQSKEELISVRLDQLVELLGKDQLSRALETQADVDRDLQTLLELLLSENRSKHIESEKARIREYLKRLNRLIKQEKDVQGRTTGGDDAGRLTQEQAQLAEKTGELSNDVKKNEENGKPDAAGEKANGEKKGKESGTPKGGAPPPNENGPKRPDNGSPPSNPEKSENPPANPADGPKGQSEQEKREDGKGQEPSGGDDHPKKKEQEQQNPARQSLESAQQRMKEAEAKLKEAERKGAAEKQEEAIRELEQAKARLEEILRQLREEEITRTLAMLEARFRQMLAMQQEVYEGTVRLDAVPEADRTHNHEIESSRLSGKEAQIVVEIDKALLVLREDGSAVAIPEAAEQMREDMQQVVQRLAQAKVGKVTQNIEEDIIASLQEVVAALKKAQKDQEKKGKSRRQAAGSPQDPPLVDALAELKMIRSLQMQVNTRTQRYSKMIEGEQAENAELVEALRRLAEREQRIHRVTRDLQTGKNQ